MNTFKTNIISIYGNRGKAWLENLPEIVKATARAYGLSDLTPVGNLSYNYVLSGVQGNAPIILKQSLDIEALRREAAAFAAFAGFGTVKVLAEDKGMLILERVVPGDSLKSYFSARDDEAIYIACTMMKRLHLAPLPKDGTFPHIKDWLMALDREWDMPTSYLHKARQLRDNLLATSSKSVLLHGDLHHDNILFQHDKDWLVIDPKGVIGEPAYEVAAFIRNPIPELVALEIAPSIINNRITTFAKILNLPLSRIIDWCFVQSVLSWVWYLEDSRFVTVQSSTMGGYDVSYFRRLTEIFDSFSRVRVLTKEPR